MRCRKRNPRASRLAGIVDSYGGIRFVVTHRKQLKHHVRYDELLFMVPGLLVHEPIAWNDIPMVIARIELEVEKQLVDFRPNERWQQEAVAMYRLRQLEYGGSRRSLNLTAICET